MSRRFWNWRLWAGFLLCLVGFISYFVFFYKFPSTRDVPWASFPIFGAAIPFLVVGLRRAFGEPQQYRGKIVGPVLSVLSLLVVGVFCSVVFFETKHLPASSLAPQVGKKAPEFTLPDANNHLVALSTLLSSPLPNSQTVPKGVLLVFYRGYW